MRPAPPGAARLARVITADIRAAKRNRRQFGVAVSRQSLDGWRRSFAAARAPFAEGGLGLAG
jgi:hypothetical protein